MHRVRVELLHFGQQVAVERELQHVPGRRRPAELSVDDFVAVVAQSGGARHLAQEVRVADEVAVQEGGLVDEVGAGLQGDEGLRRRLGWVAGCFSISTTVLPVLSASRFRSAEYAASNSLPRLKSSSACSSGLVLLRLQRLVVERRAGRARSGARTRGSSRGRWRRGAVEGPGAAFSSAYFSLT